MNVRKSAWKIMQGIYLREKELGGVEGAILNKVKPKFAKDA